MKKETRMLPLSARMLPLSVIVFVVTSFVIGDLDIFSFPKITFRDIGSLDIFQTIRLIAFIKMLSR